MTDRLHAAVLGLLMGKRVVALDNANGKISAIYDDYMHELEGIELCGSLAEVPGAVSRALESHPG
ncbi:hypothetical protein HT102_07755 [Hoyosella sp. G463]|uniref:Polysaccharide pyruvyl transferase domain-containing protein n=1 Tax=Lolliginicoccus lacisalsi TaxID=2742202 RepID=A0A927PM25_9ACTN|nr:hypothetical protein [Lolliginicoccus lacisalsi]